MANEKRLIDANALIKGLELLAKHEDSFRQSVILGVVHTVKVRPTVDAVEMPEGRPGDYLEWDNGTGFKQIYCINSVMICEDCMRYELANFTPVVNHPNIVRILSLEEAEQEWREMCAKAMPMEEPQAKTINVKMPGKIVAHDYSGNETDFDYSAED